MTESHLSDILLTPERWQIMVGTPDGATSHADPGGIPPPSAERRAWSETHAHARPFREILLVVRGTDWFGMGGALHPRRPGTLFVIEPHVSHDLYYPNSAHGLEHILLTVFGEILCIHWRRVEHGQSRRLHRRFSVIPSKKIGISLKQFPDPFVPIVGPRDIARIRMMVGMVTTYLEPRIIARPGKRKRRRSDLEESPQQVVVNAIREHIEKTVGKGITLDALAEFSGYSKFHLHRVFQTHVGCTIHQYIDLTRYRRMCFLQDEGAGNAAISKELGFANGSAFLRWRRKQGQTLNDQH